MKMKKAVSMVLAIAMLMSLAACGGSEQQANDSKNSTKAEISTTEAADTESEAPENNQIEETAAENNQAEELAFEEITVVDNDQCLIKITGIDPDNMWGYTLEAYMENKSGDKTYMFTVTNAAVNGVQSDPGFATEITAGKKSNEEINFSDDALSEIGDFTDIELSFKVYDSDDWSADAVAEETIHVYPYGEDKATEYVRESKSTDTVIVDNENVSVIVTDYDENGFWGYTVNLFLVNKTDKELMYSVDEASVNGFMLDPFWATSVGAGKVAFASISWFDSDFEDNGITSVEEIEMKFQISDNEDWTADEIYNEVVTLNP